MKVLLKKIGRLCREVVAYIIAILILLVCGFVPVTIIAWCIQFWVSLF